MLPGLDKTCEVVSNIEKVWEVLLESTMVGFKAYLACIATQYAMCASLIVNESAHLCSKIYWTIMSVLIVLHGFEVINTYVGLSWCKHRVEEHNGSENETSVWADGDSLTHNDAKYFG